MSLACRAEEDEAKALVTGAEAWRAAEIGSRMELLDVT